ncbi:MAG: hypothetical protein K2J87_05155, partial [Muribaculaceae bacterium]|nr:hypothetical protein [Muribaculaceae bacterium]
MVPDQSIYKHGYVTTGWTVDRLDKRGYVALSPTYNASEVACENLLTLPELEIEEGNTLCWEARSVYRHFPESYRVMAYPEDGGEPILLLEVESESYFWKNRGVSLEALSGRKVKFGFVCTSKSGYMLALTGVKVGSNEIPAENPESSDADYAIDPDFIRALVVDKGTGMWCTNCPEGETVIEDLTERFSSRLIVLNTHVQDVLANNPYWEKLEYYSVPRMMLNRIRATEGANANKFTDYYYKGSSFGIRMDAPVEIAGRNMKVNAQVRVSEDIDNPDGRYSVGYVITGNFHDADNVRYQQKNNCTQP